MPQYYRSTPSTILILITTLLIVNYAHAKMYFYNPEELAGISIRSNQFMFVGDSSKMNITGRLVLADPSHGCKWDDIKNKDDFEGNIVLIKRDGCSPADKFRTAEKGKAKAVVIYADPTRFYLLAASYYLDAGGIHIPGVEVRVDTQSQYDAILDALKDSSNYVNVTVIGDDAEIQTAYFIAFSVFHGIWALINVGLGSWKVYGFILKEGKFNFTLPQMCLAVEILSNIMRIILCIEPDLGIGRGLIEFGTVGFLESGNLVWSFISTLMIAFYWDHSLKTFGRHRESLNVFSLATWKIPLAVLSVLLVLCDLVSGAIRALYFGTAVLATLILGITGIFVLCIGIFFTVNGMKVLRWAKQSNSISQRDNTMSRMTRFVVVNAVGLYAIVIGLIIAAITSTRTTWYIGYWIVLMGVNFVSTMQIQVFQPGESLGTSSGTSGGQSKSKTNSDFQGGTSNIALQEV